MKKGYIIFIVSFMFVFFVINKFNNDSKNMSLVDYNGDKLRISIDGVISNTLPQSDDYYLANYECKSLKTKLIWDKANYKLNIKNGDNKIGIACNLEFSSKPLLSQMEVGSYVKYVGDNGCEGIHCEGYNVNYVNELNMGYCGNSLLKYNTSGWRIAYKKNKSAYLISAGALECGCTNGDNEFVDYSCSSSGAWGEHVKNLNKISLKYCNNNFSNDGLCNNDVSWGINEDDINIINVCNFTSCLNKGYSNNLFNIGGVFLSSWQTAKSAGKIWDGRGWDVIGEISTIGGVRPILYLDSSVVVTGGDGTYESPYLIDNNYFDIDDDRGYLNANDDLSDVNLTLNRISDDITKMCINVDSSVCNDYIDFSEKYSLDWTDIQDGEKQVYVYYKDNYDKIISAMERKVTIDRVAPINNSVSISGTDGLNRTLTLFSDGASKMCISDTSNNVNECDKWIPYETSYNWFFVEGAGNKNIYVFFKDDYNNIADVVTESIFCTNNCYYKYWLDAFNNEGIYLMRSDGATAKLSINDTSINWYTPRNTLMNVCVDGAVCIGEDNKFYIKRVFDQNYWEVFDTSSYVDVSLYNYFSFPAYLSGAQIIFVRNDGKTNHLSNPSKTWDWGPAESLELVACTGYYTSWIGCMGNDGNYYYRTSYKTTDDYLGNVSSGFTELNFSNAWVDATDKWNIHFMYTDGENIYNAKFHYTSTSIGAITSSNISGGVKTCAGASNANVNYCIGNDNYLYYKDVTATTWTKTTLNVS